MFPFDNKLPASSLPLPAQVVLFNKKYHKSLFVWLFTSVLPKYMVQIFKYSISFKELYIGNIFQASEAWLYVPYTGKTK